MTIVNKNQYYRIFFLLSILMLLINDFFLKEKFHNFLTGKLSDFAGLFALPYFISILNPKTAKQIYISTGFIFIFWKSEFADAIILFINNLGIGINRVVDYSDNIALIILPVSYFYWNKESKEIFAVKFNLKPIIILISCFSFIATSLPKENQKVNLKSNLAITSDLTIDDITNKLKYIQFLENNNYRLEVVQKKLYIQMIITLKNLENGSVLIKLDSIKDYQIQGRLFFGISDELRQKAKNFTIKDYEKIFLEELTQKLYE